jgi:hypothetical protein
VNQSSRYWNAGGIWSRWARLKAAPVQDNSVDPPEVPDIVRRIGAEQDEVGDLPGFD